MPSSARRALRPRRLATGLVLALALLIGLPLSRPAQAATRPMPVILDTDIGDDIDDTWALGLLLKSPELDLKLAAYEKEEHCAGDEDKEPALDHGGDDCGPFRPFLARRLPHKE